MSANPNFLLGSWISDAKKCASTPDEEKQYEYNARNQITLWGPNGEIMNYANKQWGGVVADFFGPRWQLFIEYSSQILKNNGKFNQNYIKNQMFKKVEEPFTFSNKVYPTESIKGEFVNGSDKDKINKSLQKIQWNMLLLWQVRFRRKRIEDLSEVRKFRLQKMIASIIYICMVNVRLLQW